MSGDSYNTPSPIYISGVLLQGRVTDHRINLTINNLNAVLEGDGLGLIIDALKKHHSTALMEDLLED